VLAVLGMWVRLARPARQKVFQPFQKTRAHPSARIYSLKNHCIEGSYAPVLMHYLSFAFQTFVCNPLSDSVVCGFCAPQENPIQPLEGALWIDIREWVLLKFKATKGGE